MGDGPWFVIVGAGDGRLASPPVAPADRGPVRLIRCPCWAACYYVDAPALRGPDRRTSHGVREQSYVDGKHDARSGVADAALGHHRVRFRPGDQPCLQDHERRGKAGDGLYRLYGFWAHGG